MAKLYEEYLGEFLGWKQTGVIQQIQKEISLKGDKLIMNGEGKCWKKYKGNEKLGQLCQRQVWKKVYSLMAKQLKNNSSKCEENKICLMNLNRMVGMWEIESSNAEHDIKKIKQNIKVND